MAATAAEITINASPDLVWKTLADVGDIAAWLPGARASSLEGDLRIIEMANNTIVKERITSVNGPARRLHYTVVAGLPFTIDAYVQVAPAGSGARVTWGGEGIPEDMIATLGDLYASSLQGLLAYLER
jgi:carbon monoxide dehydrogenase subunit G